MRIMVRDIGDYGSRFSWVTVGFPDEPAEEEHDEPDNDENNDEPENEPEAEDYGMLRVR